jgi:molybdopterin synthase catalytic subunit
MTAPSHRPDLLLVVSEPVAPAALLREAADPACGAVASFLGSVRSPNQGEVVHHIDYEGYAPMMVGEMERLSVEARSRHALGRVVIVHRLGRLRAGEVSLAVVVASPHRHAALQACAELVEGLKARLPVWKYEVGPAGGSFVPGRSDAGPTL